MKETDMKLLEIWYNISELESLRNLNKHEINDFLLNFDFISKKGGFITIKKLLFIIDCLRFLEHDIKELAEILDFRGFEALIQEILLRYNYRAIKNFRFSDKSNFKLKTKQGRYEIDVIGINRNVVLIIDAKQYRKKESFSFMNKAANLQYQRVIALKKNPEIFADLIQKIMGIRFKPKNYLPFILIPAMVTLENNVSNLNEKQVPLVSILNLNSFLRELKKDMGYYRTIQIKRINLQTRLF